MYLILGVALLAQVQTLVPIERPQTAADQIRQLCPIASPRDRQRLDRLEHQFADSVAAKSVSPAVWQTLGCVRALLALNTSLDLEGGSSRPMDASRVEAAMGVLLKVPDRQPDDREARELLAALSQQATEKATNAGAMLLDDLALAMHRAIQTGVTSPAVFRACTRLMIAVGDIATARDCSARALRLGHDSTWHLLRLARVDLSAGDRAAAIALFERAARSAHDSAAMNELLYPFFSEANWARWLAVPDTARGGWLRDSLFPDKFYQSESYRARLAQQLAGSQEGGGRSFYWWCWRTLPATCQEPAPKGETVIRTAAQLNQLWDLKTGEPIALLTFGVRVGDLTSEKENASRVAAIEITVHTWDETGQRWSDTTVERRLRFPASAAADAFATAWMTIPTSPGVTSWAIRIFQSATRRGRAADDRHAPLGTGPMQLSDLLVGEGPGGSPGENGRTGLGFAPLGHVKRGRPMQLLLQVQSNQDRPNLRLMVVLRRTDGDRLADSSALQLSFDVSSKRGITEFQPTVPISQLSPGSYDLQVMVFDQVNGAMTRRNTTVLID